MFTVNGIDVVVRLRDLRRASGLSQREVALLSGIGEKTLSSFETGARIDTMKIEQLRRILTVYGVTEGEFFGDDFEEVLGMAEASFDESDRTLSAYELLRDLRSLPYPVQSGLTEKIRLMIDTAKQVQAIAAPVRYQSPQSDWEMLNSRN